MPCVRPNHNAWGCNCQAGIQTATRSMQLYATKHHRNLISRPQRPSHISAFHRYTATFDCNSHLLLAGLNPCHCQLDTLENRPAHFGTISNLQLLPLLPLPHSNILSPCLILIYHSISPLLPILLRNQVSLVPHPLRSVAGIPPA